MLFRRNDRAALCKDPGLSHRRASDRSSIRNRNTRSRHCGHALFQCSTACLLNQLPTLHLASCGDLRTARGGSGWPPPPPRKPAPHMLRPLALALRRNATLPSGPSLLTALPRVLSSADRSGLCVTVRTLSAWDAQQLPKSPAQELDGPERALARADRRR